jgi:hypothetical protein
MQKQGLRAAHIQLIVLAAWLTAGASAAVGFGLHRRWNEMILGLGFTALVLFGETKSWKDRVAGPGFAGFAMLATVGLLRGIPALSGLLTVAAALIAWDLQHYGQRLDQVARIEAEPTLIQDHLRRLFMTVGAGVVLAGIALLVRTDYSVNILIVLGLVVAFGLSRAVTYLRRESD